MRNRVALVATLITLILLVALAVSSCLSQVEEHNEQLSGELELACTLVSESAPSGNKTEGFSAISQYLKQRDIFVSLYATSGQVIYAADGGINSSLTEDEIARATAKGISDAYEMEGSDGETILCAVDVLDDGNYIKATTEEE